MMSDVARIFIKENDNIDIDDFIEKLKSYWGLQGYDGELSLDKKLIENVVDFTHPS